MGPEDSTGSREEPHRGHPGDRCLEAEELIALLEQGRGCHGYRAWMEHLHHCAMCRETWREVQRVERARRRWRSRRFRQGLFWGLAVGVILLVLGIFLFLAWQARGGPH